MTVLALSLALLALAGCIPSYGTSRHLLSLNKRAAQAYRSGQAALALRLYRRILRRDRNDPVLWTRVGNLEAFLNHPTAAVRAYHTAVSLDRNMTEAWYNMGLVEMRQAWASFIAAYATLPAGNPLRKKLARIVKGLAHIARPAGSPRHSSGPATGGKPHGPHASR